MNILAFYADERLFGKMNFYHWLNAKRGTLAYFDPRQPNSVYQLYCRLANGLTLNELGTYCHEFYHKQADPGMVRKLRDKQGLGSLVLFSSYPRELLEIACEDTGARMNIGLPAKIGKRNTIIGCGIKEFDFPRLLVSALLGCKQKNTVFDRMTVASEQRHINLQSLLLSHGLYFSRFTELCGELALSRFFKFPPKLTLITPARKLLAMQNQS